MSDMTINTILDGLGADEEEVMIDIHHDRIVLRFESGRSVFVKKDSGDAVVYHGSVESPSYNTKAIISESDVQIRR